MKLSQLKAGEMATVSLTDLPNPLILRLIDMGINPTSPIKCLFESLSGGMKAYSIGESVVALRDCDAQYIEVFL